MKQNFCWHCGYEVKPGDEHGNFEVRKDGNGYDVYCRVDAPFVSRPAATGIIKGITKQEKSQ